MGRNLCGVKQKVRKGLWSPEEDEKLYDYITRFGVGCWSSVPKLAGLQRCGKSCRLRWINYLRPDLKRGMFSQEEENLILSLHEALGNRWAQIAAQLPGRTDNEIKNFWNSSLKKKLMKQGIDPNTHRPINEIKTEAKGDQKYVIDSSSTQTLHSKGLLPNLASSSRIDQQQHTYNFSDKQAYDPLLSPEFQPNLDPHYYYQSANFLTQNSMPNLMSFDQQSTLVTEYCNNSFSRTSKFVVNEARDGPSATNSNVGAFCWDAENNKLESMFRFQFSGIQIEDKRQSLWQQEEPKKFDQGSAEGFSNYPLSQEVTEANLDVFHQI